MTKVHQTFFNEVNQFDPQIERQNFSMIAAQEIIDAGARRLVKVAGARQAAMHFYQLADRCAAAAEGVEFEIPPKRTHKPLRAMDVIRWLLTAGAAGLAAWVVRS